MACEFQEAGWSSFEEKAFANYIRGVVNTRDTAYNMTLTDNGAVIPTTIANRIIKKVYDISPILERSTKYNVKGKLELPYYDESTLSWVNKNSVVICCAYK